MLCCASVLALVKWTDPADCEVEGSLRVTKIPSSKTARASGVKQSAKWRGKSATDPAGATAGSAAKRMTRAAVRSFIEALAVANPEPASELEYDTPFTLLVAVVLSAQATDVSVNRVTKTLFTEAATPGAMVRLGVDGVARHIRSIGLWQGKARNVVELSRQLLVKHGGEVPADREALEALPGVGRKTASVVLNVAFKQDTMAVDTHIFRLGNRTGMSPGRSPRAVEDGLVKCIPSRLLRHAHHWLILHGRYVCKARKPECWRCVAAPWCLYQNKTPTPETSVAVRTP
jgi:endonuclease III